MDAGAPLLGKLPNGIQVGGHTDARPYKAGGKSNWDLAFERANKARTVLEAGGLRPGQAIAQSFRGCLRNIIPFLAYGVILLVLALVASIPLLLGWFVLTPGLIASVHAAFRDIYFEGRQ